MGIADRIRSGVPGLLWRRRSSKDNFAMRRRQKLTKSRYSNRPDFLGRIHKAKMKDKSWHDTLIEILKDPQEAASFLNAALDEGDPKMFLVALRDVAEARGGMRELSRRTGLNRANLHKMLSKAG